MAKFDWDKADSVPQSENNSESRADRFLRLQNDKECALVRFLANSIDDIELHSTHRVHVKSNMGKEWDAAVECLRTDGGQPVSACPFCEQGIAIKNEIYMQVFDESTKTAKVFTRPKGFVDSLRTMFNTIQRFGNGAPVVSALVKITRNGAKGSKDTSYTLEVMEFTPGVTLETLQRDYGVGIADIHTLGCLRDVTWAEANEWARTGNLPAPAKKTVDAYGRPMQEAPKPQEAVHQPALQPGLYNPPYPQPSGQAFQAYQPSAPQAQPYQNPAPQPIQQTVRQPAPQPVQQPIQQPIQQPTASPSIKADENGVVDESVSSGRRRRSSRF